MTSEAYEDPHAALIARQRQLADRAESLASELRRIADANLATTDPSTSLGLRSESEFSSTVARERIRSLEANLHQAELEVTGMAARLSAARQEVERRDMVLSATRRRLSWRLGAPFRATHRIYIRIREMYRRPKPNPLFDEAYYLEQYPDVRETGMDPYRHYIRFGARQSRNPNPMFDSKWYIEQNEDVRTERMNPLIHYYHHGAVEGRDPHPLFSTKWYRAQLPEGLAKDVNPLEHYLRAVSRPTRAETDS